ncbi:MAG TPA: hypothetical protein PLP17_17485, partial [Oligoflexia bacterium]|nr:hypothetical protein [Oligoflexia bacterium]
MITIHDGWAKGRFSGHPMNAVNGGQLFANYEYVQLADYNSEMPYLFNPSWSRRQKHQWILERFVEKLLGATADFPNVVYEVMNEGEWYDQNALRAFQQHFLRFIEERTELPIMVNAPSLRAEAAATAVSLHEPVWDSSTDAVEAYRHYVDAYDDSPQKPVVFSEPVPEYQGGAASRDALMRLMWGTLLAGSGFFVQNDLSWRAIPGEPDLIFDIEGHASRFFAARTNIDHYSPCEEYSSTGVCLGLSGQEYIVYAQSGDTFAMDLTAFSGSVTVRF